jgi:hypothetical protein
MARSSKQSIAEKRMNRAKALMQIKPIDRLLFAQGGRCFFCARRLTKADASIEHLVPRAHDGKDNDENCVACCKQLNALFGRVSLKEKLRIILNQHGTFGCPAGISAAEAKLPRTSKAEQEIPAAVKAKLVIVLNDLHKKGASKPRTVEKLKNTMKSALKNGQTEREMTVLFQALQDSGAISVSADKVTCTLPPRAL